MDYYFPSSSDASSFPSSSSLITNLNNINNININFSNNKPKTKKGTSDHNKPTSNKNNKVKLSTDPQSVAARERRHRISERFKILQSLVPGGTNMDTVSMLEGAIQYVKFLQNQVWIHQTMINFARSEEEDGIGSSRDQYYHHDPLSGNVFQLPIHHGHPVSHLPSSASVQPSFPAMLPGEYSCFQGQDVTAEMEAYYMM